MKELWKVITQDPDDDTAGHYVFKVSLLLLTVCLILRLLWWIA